MKLSTKRGLVALAVFLSVIVGLVAHTGTGTISALGWRDIAAICPVGALEALAGAHSLLVHPAALLVAMLLVAFLVGKAFCSWVCPVPHIRDFFRPRKRAGEYLDADGDGAVAEVSAPAGEADGLAPAGGARDGLQIDSRHAVLVGAVASSFAFGFPVFCLICPVGLSFAVVIGVFNLLRFGEVSWGLIAFPLLVIAEVVFFRKWCTRFCPISALLSLVAARSRTLRPVVERHTCLRSKGVDCRTCVEACPERVDPHAMAIPECSRCGDCAEKCPAHAISFPLLAARGGADDSIEPGERED